MKILTPDKIQIDVTILQQVELQSLLLQFNGKNDDSLRKQWTARTFILSNGKILIEFYDGQAALIGNLSDFKKIERIRFVKNNIDFLKKNISYKIEMSVEEGNSILNNEHPRKLDNFKSDMPEVSNFEAYELATGQILFLEKWNSEEKATI